MDAETKALLLKYLEVGADRLERGAAFVEAEIPLVVQEYLSWYWWSTCGLLITWLLVAVGCIIAGCLVPLVFRMASKSLDWEAELTVLSILQAAAAGVLGIISIGSSVEATFSLVKVSVAPRVVILEKIAEVAK